MNKLVLFTTAVLAAVSAQAQFTVTQANLPTTFNVEYRSNDTLPASTITAGNSGANQTWDLTALKARIKDTTTYMSPSGTPAAASFAQANLASYNSTDGYVYLNGNSNYFGVLGAYRTNPIDTGKIKAHFNPVDRIFHFPSTYLTAYADTQQFQITFYYGKVMSGVTVDSIRINHKVVTQNVFDAYGIITTPTASFSNVMRLKQYAISKDSVDGYVVVAGFGFWKPVQTNKDTTTTYSWLSNDYKFNIANIGYDGSALRLTGASYLTNLPAASAIHEIAADKGNGVITIFPNPASTILYVNGLSENAANIEVYDIAGKKLNTIAVQYGKQTVLNTANYLPGLYLYKVLTSQGALLNAGKFSVAN